MARNRRKKSAGSVATACASLATRRNSAGATTGTEKKAGSAWRKATISSFSRYFMSPQKAHSVVAMPSNSLSDAGVGGWMRRLAEARCSTM